MVERNWKYKDWETSFYPEGNLLKTITHGKAVRGHEFGIVKSRESCSDEYIWLSISSYKKDINDIKNKEFLLNIKIDNKDFKLKAKVTFVNKFSSTITIVTFTNIKPSKKFIDLLKKGNSIEVSLLEPKELVKKFDIPFESFSLNGFVANYTKINESCKDLTSLNIPAPKIKKELKTYKVNNLITNHSLCNNDISSINHYINKETYRATEFTLLNNYIYFTHGNDGQDKYEDINVINICNPENPKLVTKITNSASQTFGFYTDNNYIYLDSSTIENNSIKIIDPNNFSLLSQIDLDGAINPYIIKDSYLYVVVEKKLYIYNLRDKKNPIKEKEFEIPFKKYSADSIDVNGDFIYITGNNQLFIYNKNSLDLISNTIYKNRTANIIVDGDKAILSQWNNGGSTRFISLIDLKNKKNPKLLKVSAIENADLKRISPEFVVYNQFSPRIIKYISLNDLYEKINNKSISYRNSLDLHKSISKQLKNECIELIKGSNLQPVLINSVQNTFWKAKNPDTTIDPIDDQSLLETFTKLDILYCEKALQSYNISKELNKTILKDLNIDVNFLEIFIEVLENSKRN